MKDLHVQISDELMKKIKIHCAKKGIKLKDFVIMVLIRELNVNDNEA